MYEDSVAGIGDPFGYLQCQSIEYFDTLMSKKTNDGASDVNVSITCGGRKSFIFKTTQEPVKKHNFKTQVPRATLMCENMIFSSFIMGYNSVEQVLRTYAKLNRQFRFEALVHL